MLKFSRIIPYGNRRIGQSHFDDETDVPIIRDPDTGEDYASLFVSGVNAVVSPDGKSSNPIHGPFAKKYMPYVSEFVSNSIGGDKNALRSYLVRYARSMKAYKDKHGHYPKQRIIGHSRGGGGALEIMEALAKEHPELPRFDEYVGLDPYDTPFARLKRTVRNDGTLVAGRSFIIRPKRTGIFVADGSDVNGDGKVSLGEKIRGRKSNLLVRFGYRMNPFSMKRTLDVAVPGANHASVKELMEAYLSIRRAKTRRDAAALLRKKYGPDDPAMVASYDSPEYGVSTAPNYLKVASVLARLG